MALNNLTKKQKAGYLLMALFIVGFVSLAGIKLLLLHGGAKMYAGEIVTAQPNHLVIKNLVGAETPVIISAETKIMSGGFRIYEQPQTGHVLVVGIPNERGEISARVIRVFNNR